MNRLKEIGNSVVSHSGFRRYAANTIWMLAEQMMRMVAGLLVGIWVARYLGPTQFGLFSYAFAFAALFGSISKMGLDHIMVRDLVREPNQRDIYMGTAFWLKLVGAVIMLAVIGVALQLTRSDSTTTLYIFIIASGAIFQSFEVIDFYFQSKVLSKFVSICKLIQLFISSIIKLYLIYTESILFWFVIVSLFDQITLALTLWIAYGYQKNGSFIRNFDMKVANRLLKDSWPQIINGMAIIIYIRIDQILVQKILGSQENGLYSAALRLSEVWYFIPVLITQSLFPSIVSVKQNNPHLYDFRMKKLYLLLSMIALGLALPMSFLSNWLIVLLYGEAYKAAGSVLMLHIWGGIFVAVGVVGNRWLVNENLQHLMLTRTIVGALLNIALSLVLIPSFGIIGAAISTITSIATASYLLDYFDKRTRKMFYQKTNSIFIFTDFK